MRIRATVVIAAALLCAANLGSAQPADPSKGVGPITYGAGTRSCGNWLADRGNIHDVEIEWVLGWLSASSTWISGLTPSSLRQTDADAVSAWVDKYCREHPLDRIAKAAMSLVDELSKPQ
jgi:hypothetical protein